MNPNTRNQLKQTLKNDGVKAVKQIAKEKYGVSKPAHQGKMVVAQAVVAEVLNEVEQDACALLEELGLSLAVKGRLISVMDVEGEYVAHAFAWGQLTLNLKAWQQRQLEEKENAERVAKAQQEKQPASQKEETSIPTPAKQAPKSRNLYLLQNWQPETMAIHLGDDGDSGNSRPTKVVTVQLKDGTCKTVGKFSLGYNGEIFASSGLWSQLLPPTEEMFVYAMNVMLGRNSIKKADIAELPFNSVWYLGF